jgi:hypothetical protein
MKGTSMGTWAVDAFGNDDAADWAYGLENVKDLSLVEATLDKAIAGAGEYLEAPEAAEALAAIEVIARLQGNWGERSPYSESADLWVEANRLVPTGEVVGKAHRVLDLVLGENSELDELWRDSDEHADWVASVAELRSRVHA